MKLPITGDAEIDQQHLILSEMIEDIQAFRNEINACSLVHDCNPNCRKQTCHICASRIKSFVTGISEFLSGHTTYEEKLMELLPRTRLCLAHIEGHKISHDHINSVIRQVLLEIDQQQPVDLCDRLISASKEWLLDHSATFDCDLAQQLETEAPSGGYDQELVSMLDAFVFHNRPTHARFSADALATTRRTASEARICYARLSQAQRRVFSLIFAGNTTPQVAVQLGISVNTVKSHRAEIFRKMEVNSLVALIKKASLLRPKRLTEKES